MCVPQPSGFGVSVYCLLCPDSLCIALEVAMYTLELLVICVDIAISPLFVFEAVCFNSWRARGRHPNAQQQYIDNAA